jgi:hypothetical protein
MQDAGKILIVIGIIGVVVGVALYLGWGPRLFGWMGHLPGDIRIEGKNSGFYFPIVTCIVLSIILTVIFRIVALIKR